MKLLTLNSHSLAKDYHEKLRIFTDWVFREKPDIIALQEVNQSIDQITVTPPEKAYTAGKIPLKSDNHALNVYRELKAFGLKYCFSWVGIKCGYGKFDEGIATFSLTPSFRTETVTLSKSDDYNLWKTRKCLISHFEDFIVCNTHMGWWDDEDEPFKLQWMKLDKELKAYRKPVFLMGDFNSPSHIKGEGYDLITSSGWADTYKLADTKDDGFTVSGVPDGWSREIRSRIDYIFTNHNAKIADSRTVFTKNTVSDHFGVMIETR